MRVNEVIEFIQMHYTDDEDIIFKLVRKDDVDIHADEQEWGEFVEEFESTNPLLDEFNTAIDYAYTEWKDETLWS